MHGYTPPCTATTLHFELVHCHLSSQNTSRFGLQPRARPRPIDVFMNFGGRSVSSGKKFFWPVAQCGHAVKRAGVGRAKHIGPRGQIPVRTSRSAGSRRLFNVLLRALFSVKRALLCDIARSNQVGKRGINEMTVCPGTNPQAIWDEPTPKWDGLG